MSIIFFKSSYSTPSETLKEIDFHFHHKILSIPSDWLFDKYFDFKAGKDISLVIKKEYSPNNSTRIWNYKMVDGIDMREQIHNFQD